MKKLTTLFLFASMVLAPICTQGQDLQFRYDFTAADFTDSSTFMRTGTNGTPAVTFSTDADPARAGVADFVGAFFTSTGYIGVQGAGARSGAFWIKAAASGAARGLMDWGVNGTNGERWTVLINPAGDILISIKGEFIGTSGAAVADDTWHHIAFTYSGGAFNATKIYKDGIELAIVPGGSATAVNTVNGGNVKIGNDFNTRKFAGQLDDVRLYSKALTPAEVTTVKDGNTLSLKGVDLNQIASIYPNPVKDRLYIKTKLNGADALNIKIYNTLGQLVNPPVYNKSNGTIEVDMKNLTSGLYFGTAKSKNASSSFKILKQ